MPTGRTAGFSSSVTTVLPDFRYRAVDASGIVDNEICPFVFSPWLGWQLDQLAAVSH